MNYTSPNGDVEERWVLKGTKGKMTKSMTPFSLHCSVLFSSCPSFCPPTPTPPLAGTHLPLTYFSCSFPPLYISLSCPFPFFGIFWHCIHSNFRQKRAQKWDRWRDESRSRRQMEGEREDGRRRKEQSLLFLAAGPSYFILLYNWYSLYITITVSLLTLKPKLYLKPP